MKIIKFYFLLLSFYALQAAAQNYNPKERGNFFVSNYDRSFLNTVSGNWSILQDENGVIYIGNTAEGILTYDGQKIRRVFNEDGTHTSGLTRAIFSDSKNLIYAIIADEFGYVEKNKLGDDIFISLSKKLNKEQEVNSTLWSAGAIHDTVIFQSEKAVYMYKGKTLLKVQEFDNNILHTININKQGAFLRVWGKGLYKFIDGEFKLLPATTSQFAQNRIDEQYRMSNGENLIVSRNIGLWYLKNDGSILKANSPIIDKFIKDYESYQGGEKLKNNIIPISTSKGGLLFIDEKLQIQSILNKNNGLKFNNVTSFIQDREGDVWGSSNNIFKVNFDTTITYFSSINNIQGYVTNISRIDGKLYIRTGIDFYQLNTPKSITETAFFEKKNVNELPGSPKGVLKFKDQIITTNNYTIKTTKNNITKIISPKYRSRVTIISKLNPNLIFTSNYVEGLLIHEFKNNNWNEIKLNTNGNLNCFDLVEIVPGQIILTTRKGLYKYSYSKDGQGTFMKLNKDKSFSKDENLQMTLINDSINLFLDSSKNIYTVDLKENLVKFSGFNLSKVISDDSWSYTYNPVSHNGWMKTSKGIFKTSFNLKDGFTFQQYPFYKVSLSELSPGFFAEGAGENEILWIGSQDEKIYRYFPELALKQKQLEFSALIRAVFINGQKAPLEIDKIPFNKNNLIFEVAYPVFGNETKTTFSYWLEGQDSSWSAFIPDYKKEYTNLEEGKYKFRVRAMDASGQISQEGVLEFKISPPWYRTIWAYLIYLLTLIYFFIQFGKFQAKKSLIKAENERKNSELAAAKDLQERLLPKTLPLIKDLDIAGYLRTSTEVGGDYYDFFEINDGSLYAICGDATGHGTPSGMLVSITKAGLIGLPQMEPKDMLHELNRVVKKVDLGILRMSLNIAYIKGDQLTLSSAGMPPYFIYRAASNTTEEILISGVPLGSFNQVTFDQIKTTFKAGDILAIISDGLAEAPNATGELFDYPRIQNIINENSNMNSQTLIEKLMSEADTWLAGKHNPDDITIVIIKHNI